MTDDVASRLAYSVMPTQALEHLMRRVPDLSVMLAGDVLPLQIGGSLGELEFYFRAEWGYAEIKLAAKMWVRESSGSYELTDGSEAPLYRAYLEDGVPEWIALDSPELDDVFCRLLQNLERSPRYWEFANARGDKFGAWGETADEAWTRMFTPIDYLTEKGVSPVTQLGLVEQRQMNPQTITVDDRVWPARDPEFIVLP